MLLYMDSTLSTVLVNLFLKLVYVVDRLFVLCIRARAKANVDSLRIFRRHCLSLSIDNSCCSVTLFCRLEVGLAIWFCVHEAMRCWMSLLLSEAKLVLKKMPETVTVKSMIFFIIVRLVQ